MAKTKKSELEKIELHPDAWKRFEKFVDTKVRTRAAPAKPPKAKKRTKKG